MMQTVVGRYAQKIRQKNLNIELDLAPIQAKVDQRIIDQALCLLIEYAIEKSPNGGEVDITLVDSDDQWELEIADSRIEFEQMPVLDRNEIRLYDARRAAKKHGGLVRSFLCPQGGTANSLVIPHKDLQIGPISD